MKRIPPYQSMNFSFFSGMLDQFKDSKDIQDYYEMGGLNGLEVILVEDIGRDCLPGLFSPGPGLR